MNYEELVYSILREIDFTGRFKRMVTEFNSFEQRMRSTQKKEILYILKSLGYDFKYFDRNYVLDEKFNSVKLRLVLDIKYGTVLAYLYVFKNEELLRLVNGHFAFLNRFLLKNDQENMTAPFYTSYDDFKVVIKDILNLYEDFKAKFINLVNA